jgi:hypothetical protein
MNSDINNNSDTLYSRLMAWLLQESVPAATPSVHGQPDGSDPIDELEAADFQFDELDPLDVEDVNIAPTITGEIANDHTRVGSEDIPTREDIEPGGTTRPYNLGDMPIVQNRFEALIKRKLQVEIERHPPLFPWETNIHEYEPDISDSVASTGVPSVQVWTPQLLNLPLPVPIPENVLVTLFNACSESVYSPYQLGRKMVKAVENLFPAQFQLLNNQAQMVLLSSGSGRDPEQLQLLLKELPSPSYDEATPEQQMILALLAAKEIISTLTVSLSPNHPSVERQWQTSVGVITVQAEYQIQEGVPTLRVISNLPESGSLTLRTPEGSAVSERTYPGYVSVEAFDLPPNQTYPLEIRFQDSDQNPLVFAIYPTL